MANSYKHSHCVALETLVMTSLSLSCDQFLCVLHKWWYAYHFSQMDLISLCALLQTQLNGPFASFLMQSRDNPIQILGMIACVICSMLVATVLISTITFVRNKKSNKILPSRRIIRRRPKHRQWGFKVGGNSGKNFEVKDEPENVENINCNNNVHTHCHLHHHPPPPMYPPPMHPPHMHPPGLPPPLPCFSRPSERQWAGTPVSSSTVVLKPMKRLIQTKENNVNTALVSELKMRLEQKRMASQYWLFLSLWMHAAVECDGCGGGGPGVWVAEDDHPKDGYQPKGQLKPAWRTAGLPQRSNHGPPMFLTQASTRMSVLNQDRRRTLCCWYPPPPPLETNMDTHAI